MKKTIIRLSEILFILWVMCGPLPQSPNENPRNATIAVLTINSRTKYVQPVSVIAKTDVAIQFGIKNSWFIDSIGCNILMNNKETENGCIMRGPWATDTIDTSFVFPSQGTGTLLYTAYRNNNTIWSDTLIFNVTAPQSNHAPVWSPKRIQMFSEKGIATVRDLLPYVEDPDDDGLSFELGEPVDNITLDDTILSSTKALATGEYEIKVIASDGMLTDTAMVYWTVFTVPKGDAEIAHDRISVVSDNAERIDVLANDKVPSGSLLSFVSQGNHGKAVISNEMVVYTSVKGYVGSDTLWYIVNGKDTGWVFLSVTSEGVDNYPPVWSTDTVELYSQVGTVAKGNAAEYVTDPEDDVLSYDITLPSGTGFSIDGSVISSAAGSAAATYYITVRVSDGTSEASGVIKWTIFEATDVSVMVTDDQIDLSQGETATLAVLDNDTITSGDGSMLITGVLQGQHGKAAIQDGSAIVYTPDGWFSGHDTLFYIVNGRDTGGVYLTITGIEIELAPDTVSVEVNETVTAKVLENDKIISEKGTMTITSVGGSSHGTVSCAGTAVRYTPETGYSGTDRFYYIVNGKDTGWVDVTVTGTETNFTVTFDKNDASASGTMAPQTIASGTKGTLAINSYKKAGYTFTGWGTTADGSVAYKDGAEFTMGSEDITLYAIWTVNVSYSITFEKNDDAAVGTMVTQSVPSGATAVLNTNTFMKDGWSFMGWATSVDGTVAYADGADYTIGTESIVLYAVWSASDFAVTFNKNDPEATGGMLPQIIAAGSSAPLTANAFEKNAWKFEGWATSADGTVEYADCASFTMGSVNVTLFAIWSAQSFTVVFNKNDAAASGTMAPQCIVTGTSNALALNTFSKTGWKFEGWATIATGQVEYTDGADFTMGPENDTLYAVWSTLSHKVTFDKNDAAATGTMTPQIVMSDAAITLNANAFSKTGWSFAGWAITAEGDVAYADGAEYTIGTQDATLYAKWVAQQYTLTFDANTGTGTTPAAVKYDYGANVTIPGAGAISKDGYDFAGWNTKADGSGTPYQETRLLIMGAEDLTLYAQWTGKTCTVTIATDDNGTVSSSTLTVGYGENCPPVTATPKNGYDFSGWTGDITGTDNPLTITNVIADMSIIATFSKQTYVVTFVAGDNGTLDGTAEQTVGYGESCTPVTAVANDYCHFVNWTGSAGRTTTSNPITAGPITASVTITANFERDQIPVHFVIAANGGGTITGSMEQKVYYGENCTEVTAVPETGYRFVNWTGSRGNVVAINPFTAQNITTEVTITATFERMQYRVEFYTNGEGGWIKGISEQTVYYGDNCEQVTAVPNDGYHFVNWTGSAGRTATTNPFIARNVTQDITITANFEPD